MNAKFGLSPEQNKNTEFENTVVTRIFEPNWGKYHNDYLRAYTVHLIESR
jgi:hypothetical protein